MVGLPNVLRGSLFGPCNTLEDFLNCVLGERELKLCSVTAGTSAPVFILNGVALPLTSMWQVQEFWIGFCPSRVFR